MAGLIFCKINLLKVDYNLPSINYQILEINDHVEEQLQHIYRKYTRYKKFKSVRPLFKNELYDPNSEIIGYYVNNMLVAFTCIKILDNENIESVQFAWDYNQPTLQLGIQSIKSECAIYKQRGYKYLHLGLADEYKSAFQGYEELGIL